MIEVHHLSGGVWLLGGLAMIGLGYLFLFRGRADLHADYDESVDPEYVSRWVGLTAIVMGLVTVTHGVREMLFGWDPVSFTLLLVILLVLSWVTRLVAKGWTPRSGLDDLS